MTQKYRLTSNTVITPAGVILYQIEALRDLPFAGVKKGDLGGYIEKEENLSQYENAWVFDSAQVFGTARVFASARVFGSAQVYENARVYENAQVSGRAQVSGSARVYENAWVFGRAQVSGSAQVFGTARVSENARVSITPINLIGLRYGITITDEHIKIGCEQHTKAEWEEFTDAEIKVMEEPTSLPFWEQYRSLILALAKSHGPIN